MELHKIAEKALRDQVEPKKLIKELLAEDERARNDDLWLVLKFWERKQHVKLLVGYEEIESMVSPETICRIRRVIQNTEHEYMPTDPDIVVKRRIKESVCRAYYAGNQRLLEEILVRRSVHE